VQSHFQGTFDIHLRMANKWKVGVLFLSKRDGSNLLGFGKNCSDKCERGPLQASYTTSINGEGYQCN
jgi:hypothetical protein